LPRQIICLGPDFFSHACADRSSSPAPSLDSRTVLVRHPVRSEVFISFTREVVRRPRLLAVFFLCGRHVPRSRSSRRLDSFPVFVRGHSFPLAGLPLVFVVRTQGAFSIYLLPFPFHLPLEIMPPAGSGSPSLGVSFSPVIPAQALGDFSVPAQDLSCRMIRFRPRGRARPVYF
jgi:hypothetical protein